MSKLYTTRGITILEAVIYVGILAIVAATTVNTFIVMTKVYRVVRVERGIQQSAETGLDFMMREVRRATFVNTGGSSFGTDPGTLALDTTTFSLSNGRLTAVAGGGAATPITPANAVVTSLVFYHIRSTTTSEAVSVVMRVVGTAGAFSKEVEFRDTAVLRGSY